MHREEECPDLIPCPWCKCSPVLCSDGFGDHWVECCNAALPSDSGKTCPVCPKSRAAKTTLEFPKPIWTRDEAIKQWNNAQVELEELK